MKHILVATDLSAYSSWAVSRALLVAAKQKAALHVIAVVDESADLRQVKEGVRAQISESGRATSAQEPEIAVVTGDPFHEIIAHGRKAGADLLCIGMHDKRAEAIRERFFTTLCERLMRKAALPVLMVCAPPQEPYQRVLIGTDFSDGAHAAFRQGLLLGQSDARFCISHIYQMPGLIRDPYALADVKKEHKRALSDFLKDEQAIIKRCGTPKIEQDLREDFITPGLREAVREFQPDLMALGAHGHSRLSLAIIGSTAQDFLIDPPCDILIGR